MLTAPAAVAPAAQSIAGGPLGLEVFSTAPESRGADPATYRQRVEAVARWSEAVGCKGILIYTDNALADPWLVAQTVAAATERLRPLVALQPVYMHPYAAAKMVSTLGLLHGREVWLNLVAGGFPTDLAALDDTTPHDRRYDRLVEYATIVRRLLEGGAPLTFEGEFYRVRNLRLAPAPRPDLPAGMLISGSSPAGRAAARAIGATPVEYPGPPSESAPAPEEFGQRRGLRVGIVARPTDEQAWEAAWARFPADRKGQIAHSLAMKLSDSSWHRKLSEMGDELRGRPSPYWLHPFENYRTFCPYLVGSYETVAGELARYFGADYRTFILDIPADEAELDHIGVAFSEAARSFLA